MTNETSTPLSSMVMPQRPRKSYEPDLEIAVGPEKQVFRYHSVILASYSDYIDTMLVTPMREQTTKKISFPDITPEIWQKMILFHEPRGTVEMDLDDYCELLPFFDKYGFIAGVEAIDDLFARRFKELGLHSSELLPVALTSFHYQLPKSKGKALQFAKRTLEFAGRKAWKKEDETLSLSSMIQEDEIRSFISMIQEDESALKHIVTMTSGMEAWTMSIEELREVTSEESFPGSLKSRSLALDCFVDTYGGLITKVNYLEVTGFGEGLVSMLVDGGYELDCHYRPGVMRSVYVNDDIVSLDELEEEGVVFLEEQIPTKVVIRSRDPFGTEWEMVGITLDDNGDEQVSCVYYTWDSFYSSVVPPRYGWKAVEEDAASPTADPPLMLEYNSF